MPREGFLPFCLSCRLIMTSFTFWFRATFFSRSFSFLQQSEREVGEGRKSERERGEISKICYPPFRHMVPPVGVVRPDQKRQIRASLLQFVFAGTWAPLQVCFCAASLERIELKKIRNNSTTVPEEISARKEHPRRNRIFRGQTRCDPPAPPPERVHRYRRRRLQIISHCFPLRRIRRKGNEKRKSIDSSHR